MVGAEQRNLQLGWGTESRRSLGPTVRAWEVPKPMRHESRRCVYAMSQDRQVQGNLTVVANLSPFCDVQHNCIFQYQHHIGVPILVPYVKNGASMLVIQSEMVIVSGIWPF